MSTTQLLIFLFERIDNISQFIAGFIYCAVLTAAWNAEKENSCFSLHGLYVRQSHLL